MAVALAATLLTHAARAQLDPPQDTSSPNADTATPLALRANKPLELSREPEHTSLGWQVVAVVAIIGGAVFYMRKRVLPQRPDAGGLAIVRRTPIGLRCELLVVNVEGQRLLIGVTPHSIQSLAVLDGEEAEAISGETSNPVPTAVGDRFAAMLKAAEPRDDVRGGAQARRSESGSEGARATADALRANPPEASREAALAGQARGLAGLRRRV